MVHARGFILYLIASGYRLTFLGYDYLAIRALGSRGTDALTHRVGVSSLYIGVISGVGNQIGVGKESGTYVCRVWYEYVAHL